MVSRKVIRADNFSDANSIILIIAMMYDGDLMRVHKPWRHLRRPRPPAIWSQPETSWRHLRRLIRRRQHVLCIPGDVAIWEDWNMTALGATSPLFYQVCTAYCTTRRPLLLQPLQALSRLLTSFLPFSLFFLITPFSVNTIYLNRSKSNILNFFNQSSKIKLWFINIILTE